VPILAGVRIDQSRGGIISVYSTSNDSHTQESIRRLLPADATIEFSTVDYSLVQLSDVAERIGQYRPALAAQGIEITLWGTDTAANRVVVGVKQVVRDQDAEIRRIVGSDAITTFAVGKFIPETRTTNAPR